MVALAQTAEDPAGKPDQAPAATEAAEELDLLSALDLVYIQQQAAADDRTAQEEAKKQVAKEAESLKNYGPSDPKPYSFLLLEDLRDELAADEERAESAEAELAAAQHSLQEAREKLGRVRAPAATGSRVGG